MNLLQVKEQLVRVHELIDRKATGTPSEMAERLGLAERTARRYIELLRELGADIGYCRIRQSYYYESPVVFRFGYESPEQQDEINNDIGGGNALYICMVAICNI